MWAASLRTSRKTPDLREVKAIKKYAHRNLQAHASYLSRMSKIDIFFTIHVDSELHPSSDRTLRYSEWFWILSIILAAVTHDMDWPVSWILATSCVSELLSAVTGLSLAARFVLNSWQGRISMLLFASDFGGGFLLPIARGWCGGLSDCQCDEVADELR